MLRTGLLCRRIASLCTASLKKLTMIRSAEIFAPVLCPVQTEIFSSNENYVELVKMIDLLPWLAGPFENSATFSLSPVLGSSKT